MTIRVTITKPNVFNEYGIAMTVGTTYTVSDAFGLSLITQQKASDTDSSLVNPGVTAAGPVDVVYCNAATIAAPTAAMLASYNTVFALDVAPFTQYKTTGTALYPVDAGYSRDASGNITGLTGGSGVVLNLAGITNPLTRDALGRITAYTQGSVSYTVTYGSFGISTIAGGGFTLTQNYTTAGVPSGVTLT